MKILRAQAIFYSTSQLESYMYIIPFPNKDSSVAVAAVPGFSFGLDFI